MKREITEIEMKKMILIALLLILSVNGIIFLAKFIGYASFDQAKAGYITEVDIKYTEPAYAWSGMYGVAIMAQGYNNSQNEDLGPAGMSERNLIFNCQEPGIAHEIYVTTIDPSLIDWNNIQAGSASDVDTLLGFNGTELSSAANTFTDIMAIDLGTTSILVPTVYTFIYGMSPNTTFGLGVLKDINDNLIYVANIAGFQIGFNERTYNYQMILPIPNMSTVTYYFISDPFDECPEGLGLTGGSGYVIGNVTSSTGQRLEDVIISVAGKNFVTDAFGFYNASAPLGKHTIAAYKEGYDTYVSNITINASNTTVHNIVLSASADFTGPGQTDFTNIDVGPGQNNKDGDNDNVGPGIGPGIGPYLEEPKRVEGQDFVISIPHINRRLKIDNFLVETISLYSFKDQAVTLEFSIEGNVADLIEMERDKMVIGGNSKDDFILRIFGRGALGVYNGSLKITGSVNEEIPIRIELTNKDMLDIQTLFIDIEAIEKKVNPGDVFRYKTTLRNLLTDTSYPVHLFYTITDESGEKIISVNSENIVLKTTFSLLKSEKLSKTIEPGNYILTIQASYFDLTSTDSIVFKVTLPFYKYMVFGKVPLWWIMVAIAVILTLTGLGYWYYKKVQSKKKYHLKVEYSELPKPGPRNVYIGKIAETDHKTYFNLENFKVHTIVAGSTGGGKSFAAQGIIEEMLLHNVAVIVFDPTAQWTGMLRKLTAKSILALYSIFGMKQTEARAFNGNIRQINNARELIDIKKFMKPGEIQVFACHKLDPKDMDIYVANAIREVFHANFDESRELRLVLVFDEVHRLLPKFGGSGEGFLQIERACREFRKWGLGVVLVSQVLNDFMGQIKANINTEIQMRTRDEGDLDRIATRYGKDVLQSLVKATVGSGMVENPSYNRGRPYFVSFKPIRHSVERLTDEEIEKYNKYNDDIDQLDFELEKLEKEHKQDVFDLKLELKLALDKVKSGNFNMVDIYLDGIRPRVKKFWDMFGIATPKLEKRLVKEEDLKAEMEKAKKERKKAEEEEKKKQPEQGEKKDEAKQKTSFDIITEFKNALNFSNGAQVTTLQELTDVLPTMDGNIFAKSVNKEKNDIEAWVRNKLKVPTLADKIKGKATRDDVIVVLEEEQKKPTKVLVEPKKEEQKQESAEKTEEEKIEKEKQDNKLEVKKELPDIKNKDITSNQKPEQAQSSPAKKEVSEWPRIKSEYSRLKSSKEKINYLVVQEKVYPIEANIKYALGIEYQKIKDYTNAEKKYLETLEIIPNNKKVSHYLSIVQKKLKENNGSIDEDTTKENRVPPGQYFTLSDGTELRSYNDLKKAVKNMDEESIKQYVNDEKNDFANWVEGALGNKSLADKLRMAHSKSELEEILA